MHIAKKKMIKLLKKWTELPMVIAMGLAIEKSGQKKHIEQETNFQEDCRWQRVY